MAKYNTNFISDELLASYLDGNASPEEIGEVLEALKCDERLQEFMDISEQTDRNMAMQESELTILPMTALAANGNENRCNVLCESYILKKQGYEADEEQLSEEARQAQFLKEEGTPLHRIGCLLEKKGMAVSRLYYGTMKELEMKQKAGYDMIVVVDGGELTGDIRSEKLEDLLIGKQPDHAVVFLNYDRKHEQVTLYNPDSGHETDRYPIKQFLDAWADSCYYMITARKKTKDMKYQPHPLPLDDVELTADLQELREAIAENAHEVWAASRIKGGWTYGPSRNDDKKQHPDLVAYADLPDSEKQYDRDLAMNTIKLVQKLGYDLVKKGHTELYKSLLEKLKRQEETFYCSHCGNPIYKHQVFCDRCGVKLEWMNWD